MNTIHKFFEDFDKLFYWLLILTSWLLTADIVGLFFLNKTINEIFSEIIISEILLIFMSQIIFILTSVVIYNFIKLIWVFLPKIKMNNDIDYKVNRDYYTSSELLNNAVKTNNQTMYNHYKDYKDGLKLEVNQKYLCSNVVLLMILSLCFGNSTLRVIIENYESFSTTKKMIVSFFIFFDLLGLFILFIGNSNSDYTEILKK